LSERIFLITLGFHENFAIRRLTASGAGPGDRLLVITLSPMVAGAKNAFESLSAFSRRLGVSEVRLVEVDPSSLEESVEKIIEAVDEVGGREIVVDASGGSRVLVLASLLAVTFLSGRYRVSYYIQSDTGGGWEVKVTDQQLRRLRPTISKEKERILLMVVESPGLTAEELSERLNIKEKTVKNHMSELKAMNLVTQRGRGRGYYLTSWGRLMVRSLASSG